MLIISADELYSAVTAVAGSLDDPTLFQATFLAPYPMPLHLNMIVDEILAIVGIGCCRVLGKITKYTTNNINQLLQSDTTKHIIHH